MNDAFQHTTSKCGKIFCKACLEGHIRNNNLNPCPSCKMVYISANTVKDVRMDNEVGGLLVNCPNKNKNCKWVGELKYVTNHLDTCPYHNVPCTKKCGVKMLRQSLESHLTKDCPKRSHTCPHCRLIGEHQMITGHGHLSICSGVLVSCTLCSKEVKRAMIKTHVVACRVEPVPCQYQSVGCTAQPRRQDISQHNLKAMNDHLQLAVQAIANQRTELGQQIAQQRAEIDKLKQEQQAIKNNLLSKGTISTVTLKMNNVSKFLSTVTTKEKSWYSSNFSVMGYTASLRVDFAGATEDRKFASCYIIFIREAGTHREPLFRGTITVSILNHSDSGKDHSKQLPSDIKARSNNMLIIGEKEFIQISDLLAQDKPSVYLKEDSLFFKVAVDSVNS